jgi:hypothetical protein
VLAQKAQRELHAADHEPSDLWLALGQHRLVLIYLTMLVIKQQGQTIRPGLLPATAHNCDKRSGD